MKKILLIDDENSIARLVGSMAGDAGYAFAYAEDGAEGLVVAEREAPDLVIMDVMMPEMDGLEAAKAIRALDRPDAKTIPIIAMTANVFKEDLEKCLAAGMNAHLSKPLDAETMKRTISEQLQKRK